MRGVLLLVVAVLAGVLPCRATAPLEQGVRGRVSLGGVLIEALEVRAYPYRAGSFGPLTGQPVVARALTATDGTYTLPLPPGRYVVEGLKKAEGNVEERPQAGDLHCLYSGSPIAVAAGAWTPVGLNLVTVRPEFRSVAEASLLTGSITRDGRPVEKVYLYVYADAASGFRGPAQLLQPVATGSFRVRVPPGTYHLVARKRIRGGAYGPIDIGDLFNFYPHNPVEVGSGERVTLEIPLVERLSQLEDDPGPTGPRIRVVDELGNGRSGFRILAYPTGMRAGVPLSTSAATDAEGWTRVALPPGERFYLRARGTVGGPLESGEAYADGELGSESDLILRLQQAP